MRIFSLRLIAFALLQIASLYINTSSPPSMPFLTYVPTTGVAHQMPPPLCTMQVQHGNGPIRRREGLSTCQCQRQCLSLPMSVPLPRTRTASAGRGPARSRERKGPTFAAELRHHGNMGYCGAVDCTAGVQSMAESHYLGTPGPCQRGTPSCPSAPSSSSSTTLRVVAAAEERRPADRPKVQISRPQGRPHSLTYIDDIIQDNVCSNIDAHL